MDDGWVDLVHDLTLDLRAMGHGQFVIVQHCAGQGPNPYVQAAPDGAGGWYCELVSGRYLPATLWPIDEWYLMAAGWTPPTDLRDNWSRTAGNRQHAAQVLADGLRRGRVCPDWQPVIWRTDSFPRPPDDTPTDPPTDHPPEQPGARPWLLTAPTQVRLRNPQGEPGEVRRQMAAHSCPRGCLASP